MSFPLTNCLCISACWCICSQNLKAVNKGQVDVVCIAWMYLGGCLLILCSSMAAGKTAACWFRPLCPRLGGKTSDGVRSDRLQDVIRRLVLQAVRHTEAVILSGHDPQGRTSYKWLLCMVMFGTPACVYDNNVIRVGFRAVVQLLALSVHCPVHWITCYWVPVPLLLQSSPLPYGLIFPLCSVAILDSILMFGGMSVLSRPDWTRLNKLDPIGPVALQITQ